MFKIFKRLTTKELIMIVFAVIFVCLNVHLNLKIPDYMSDITTHSYQLRELKRRIFLPGIQMPYDECFLMSFAGFMASCCGWFLAARTAASLNPFVMISSIRF